MTRYAVLVAELGALQRAAPLAAAIALRDGHVRPGGELVATPDGPAVVIEAKPEISDRAWLALLATVYPAKTGRELTVYAQAELGAGFARVAYRIEKDKPP